MKSADESEDGSDISDHNEYGEDSFMDSYSDAMNAQLKNSSLKKSFIHANEQSSVKNEVYFDLSHWNAMLDLT